MSKALSVAGSCSFRRLRAALLIATSLLPVIFCAPKENTVSTPQAVENYINNHLAELPMVTKVRSLKSGELGISGTSAEREKFIAAYSGFIIDYKRIVGQYRQNPAVTRFAAIRYRDAVLENKVPLAMTMLNRPDNSLYVAFALLTGAGIDYESIGNRQHLQGLARRYGISMAEIENGLWETLTREWDEILMAAVTMIRSNVETVLSGDRVLFVANVLQPYLVLLSKDRMVPQDVESIVLESFDALFPAERAGGHPLLVYVNAYKRSRTGGSSMKDAEDLAFNRHLKRFGFLADLEPDVSICYQLTGSPISINAIGVGDVLVRKRIGVVLPVEGEELVAYNGNDLALTGESLSAASDAAIAALVSDSVGNFFTSDDNVLWSSIGCRMRADRADTIRRQLIRSAFSGKNRAQVGNALVREAAIRELKRKWDEYAQPKNNPLNVDADVSAYLAAAVCGESPVSGLLKYIDRIQWYYRGISDTHVRSTLQPLIIEGWKIVQEAASGGVDEAGVRQKLLAVYDKYVTLDGGKLTPLPPFEEKMVKGKLDRVPVFIL